MIDPGEPDPLFQSLHITRDRSAAVIGGHMMIVTTDGVGTVHSDSAMVRQQPDPDNETEYEARFNLSEGLDALVVKSKPYYGSFEFSVDAPLKKLSAYGAVVEHSAEGRIMVYSDGSCKTERLKSDPSQSVTNVRFGGGSIYAVVGNAEVEITSSGSVRVCTKNVVAHRPARFAPVIQTGPFEFSADRCSVGMYGTRIETEFLNHNVLNVYTPSDEVELYTASARRPGDVMPEGHQHAGKIYLGEQERHGPFYMEPVSASPVTLTEAWKAAEEKGGFLPSSWHVYNLLGERRPYGRCGMDKVQLKELFGAHGSIWVEGNSPDSERPGVAMDLESKEQRIFEPQERKPATVLFSDRRW